MSILKKAVSASGPVLRALLGAGAFALLIIGLFRKPKKDGDNLPTGCKQDGRAPKSERL